jgi:Fic family protein
MNGYAVTVHMRLAEERLAHYEDRLWLGNPGGATRAERRPCRYRSYLPDCLLDQRLTLTGSLAADISDVERAVASLNHSHPGLVSLEALARLLLRAESVASSFIEGLQINVRRLAKEELAQRSGMGSHDETARAVLGNVQAMEAALVLADPTRPITRHDIEELNRELLAGTRDEPGGGRVRVDQNWIGGSGLSPCTAQFVPPPPEAVPGLLDDLCDARRCVRARTDSLPL